MSRVLGIIAEYNPFHNGHIYHINKIKEKYPDAILILVLNGYFLERGEISILTKEEKTRIALEYGVNIVLELPFLMGSQSADIFADASIKILNNYHVNKIIFGSECNDVNMLTNIAKAQFKDDFDELVKNYMNEGCNYPTALARACKVNFDFNPNDLLGISYIKAIINNNFNIGADVIKRTNSYHDKTSNEEIVSASNIREKIKENIDITNYLPNEVINSLIRIDYSVFFKLLKSKIITDNDLSSYVDVDEGIEYRLKKYINDVDNFSDYINLIKTKRYTYNKLNRMFIHILIGLKKCDNLKVIDYTKILGFDKKGLSYLNKIKNNLGIPSSVNTNSLIYQYELKTSLIYDLINNTNTYSFEIKNKPVVKVKCNL